MEDQASEESAFVQEDVSAIIKEVRLRVHACAQARTSTVSAALLWRRQSRPS